MNSLNKQKIVGWAVGLVMGACCAACGTSATPASPDSFTHVNAPDDTSQEPNSDGGPSGRPGSHPDGGGNGNDTTENVMALRPGVRILSRLAPTRCLEIFQSSGSDGAKIDVWDCNGSSPGQTWQIAGGQVRAPNNRCLDHKEGDSVALVANGCGKPDNAGQQWFFENGALKTGNGNDAQCATLVNGATANGTAVVLADCSPTSDAQHWNLEVYDGTSSRGFNVAPSGGDGKQCLAAPSSTPAADDPVKLGACAANAAQWKFNGMQGQTQLFGMTVFGQCLTAPAAKVGSGLVFRPCALTANQKWVVRGGQIAQASGNLCVSLSGVQVQLGTCAESNDDQQWTLGTTAGGPS